jgi:hypothetical protein
MRWKCGRRPKATALLSDSKDTVMSSKSLSGALEAAKILLTVCLLENGLTDAEDRDFQLITWAKDRTVRIWPMEPEILEVSRPSVTS